MPLFLWIVALPTVRPKQISIKLVQNPMEICFGMSPHNSIEAKLIFIQGCYVSAKNKISSRSGKGRVILNKCQGIWPFDPLHGIVGNFVMTFFIEILII